jgi:lipoprotein-releasing system ATP-binding protein
MDNIIITKNLYKSYGNEIVTEVLHGIDISFERGTFNAIIGPSGSGKTTLLNIISLLDPPTSGQLILNGNDFSQGLINDYAKYRNDNIGFIFQFHYLLPEFTAFENVLLPYWIGNGKPTEKIKKRALEIMDKIGILSIKDKYLNQISGGQQQRVAIARSLAKSPKIVFADEPTGNLDRETGESVIEIMTQMINELNTTLVMVTHDREIALKANRIIELVDGKICRSINIKNTGITKAKKIFESRTCKVDD